MSRPDLWDDADHAKALNAEYANLRDDVATYDGLDQALSDAEVLHELARDEGDESQEPDIEAAIADVSRRLDQLDLRSLFTGPHDRVRRDRADQRQGRRRRRPGLERDAAADVRAVVRPPRLHDVGQRDLRRDRGRHPVGRGDDLRALRLRVARRRARHPPARPDQPVRQPGSPPDELRRRAGVAGDRCARRRAQRRRRQDGGVPRLRCRRPARQQDVVGGAPDPRADRPRRQLAGGAQPAAEPGAGDVAAEGDARGQGRGGARRRARRDRRQAGAGRVGEPDPQLRAAAVPDGQGSAYRCRVGQHQRRPRRRPRRVHRGLPALAPAHRAYDYASTARRR